MQNNVNIQPRFSCQQWLTYSPRANNFPTKQQLEYFIIFYLFIGARAKKLYQYLLLQKLHKGHIYIIQGFLVCAER